MRNSRRIVVVGAGVVGLAVAQELARQGSEVWVLEKESRIGTGVSSRNSEVIHAGMYYAPGSLKALLCVEGRERLEGLIHKDQISGKFVGKLIVASSEAEMPELQKIYERSKANGTIPLKFLTEREIRHREPAVRGTAGLWSPGTGIIDSHSLMTWCLRSAKRDGAEILLRHEFLSASKTRAGWSVRVKQPTGEEAIIECDVVVNAGGLRADRISRAVMPDLPVPQHHFVKGNYFEITRDLGVRTLVYPTPKPNLVGLGTHLTRDLSGRCRLGPDVEPAKDEEDFSVTFDRKRAFFESASLFLPGLKEEDLSPSYAGIRPKLSVSSAEDFYVREESDRGFPGWVNLLGIESPGLTASLAIADRVSRIV